MVLGNAELIGRTKQALDIRRIQIRVENFSVDEPWAIKVTFDRSGQLPAWTSRGPLNLREIFDIVGTFDKAKVMFWTTVPPRDIVEDKSIV
jgi:hypothetical protein